MSAKKSSPKSGGRSSVASWSHFNKPIPDDGKPHGNSRRPGDASPEVQQLVINSLLKECADKGLSKQDTAYVLAIARHESGFNPDAASPRSSATGIGQFIDRTGNAYDLNDKNRFDIEANAKALVDHYVDTKAMAKSRGLGPEYIYKIHHDGPSGNHGGLEIARREVMPYAVAYRDSPLLANFNNTRDSPKIQLAKFEPEPRQTGAAASSTLEKASPAKAAPERAATERAAPATVVASAPREAPLAPLASTSLGADRGVAQVVASAPREAQAPLSPLATASVGADRTVSQVALAGSKQAAAPLPPSSPANSEPDARVAAAMPYADTPAGLASRVAPGEAAPQRMATAVPYADTPAGLAPRVASGESLQPLSPASPGPDRTVAQVNVAAQSGQVEQALNALSPLPQASLGADRNVAQVSVGAPGQPETVHQASAPLTPLTPASAGLDQRAAAVATDASPAQEAARASGTGYNKEEILAAGKVQDLHPSAVAAVVAHRTGEPMTADAVMQAWNSSPSLTPGSPGAGRALAQGPAGGSAQPESAVASAPLSPLTPVDIGADRQVAQVSAGAPGRPESVTASGPLSPLTPVNLDADRQVAQVAAGLNPADGAAAPLSPLGTASPGADRSVAQVTVEAPSSSESSPAAQAPLSPLAPTPSYSSQQVANVLADSLGTGESFISANPEGPAATGAEKAPSSQASVQEALQALSSGDMAPSVEATSDSLEKGRGTFFDEGNTRDQGSGLLSASAEFDAHEQASAGREHEEQVAAAETEMEMDMDA